MDDAVGLSDNLYLNCGMGKPCRRILTLALQLLAAVALIGCRVHGRALAQDSAVIPTCGDSTPSAPNVPFNCSALDPSWTYNKEAANQTITGMDVLDAITCCVARTVGSDPPNLYLSAQQESKRNQKEQDSPNVVINSIVGSTVDLTLVVGLQGLSDTRINDVTLQGKLFGVQILAVKEEPSDGACSLVPCSTQSSLTCTWPSLNWDNGDSSRAKTITLTLLATDAGITRTSVLFVTGQGFSYNDGRLVSTGDADDSDNDIVIEPRLRAACCLNTGKCRNTLKSGCLTTSAFSPYSPCSERPCLNPGAPGGGSSRGSKVLSKAPVCV